MADKTDKLTTVEEFLEASSGWQAEEMGGTDMTSGKPFASFWAHKPMELNSTNYTDIPLMEIFGPTIQGEGAYVGQPSIFVRTGYCNFRCRGFGCPYIVDGEEKEGCDSFYSVDPAYAHNWMKVTGDDLMKKIQELMPEKSHTKPHFVFTGGEPLLHWNNLHYQYVLKTLIESGYKVTIETNTSVEITFSHDYQREIAFSMSTKLAVSGEPEYKRLNYPNINNIIHNAKKSWFKFVVSTDTNIDEIIEIVNQAKPTEVYLMPMGENRTNLAKNLKFTADMALKYGFAMSPRLHIDIWNDLPGV